MLGLKSRRWRSSLEQRITDVQMRITDLADELGSLSSRLGTEVDRIDAAIENLQGLQDSLIFHEAQLQQHAELLDIVRDEAAAIHSSQAEFRSSLARFEKQGQADLKEIRRGNESIVALLTRG